MNDLATISFRCPTCGAHAEADATWAQRRVRCPNKTCGETIVVPKPTTAATPGGLGLNAQLMLGIGLFFAVIAGYLTIKEMHLEAGWIVSILLIGLAGASEFLRGGFKAATLLLFVLAGLAAPACFFLLGRDLPFYTGTGVFFVLSAFLLWRTSATWRQFDLRRAGLVTNLQGILVWVALTASFLAFAWATYFNYLTTLDDDFLWRRLVFTVFLILVGVACSLAGGTSSLPFLGLMGLTFIAAGVVKALTYDITRTDGFLRIGIFAGSGGVLLLGALLLGLQRRVERA